MNELLSKLFWEKVDKKSNEECWEWKGNISPNGYGRLGQILAHRISWKLHFGTIPFGKFILHKCNNKICVNPNLGHLYLGTKSDNAKDRERNNRRIGIATNSCPPKLKDGELWLLCKLLDNNIAVKILVKMFKCSKSYIYDIKQVMKVNPNFYKELNNATRYQS